jgi:hypothetical protein
MAIPFFSVTSYWSSWISSSPAYSSCGLPITKWIVPVPKVTSYAMNRQTTEHSCHQLDPPLMGLGLPSSGSPSVNCASPGLSCSNVTELYSVTILLSESLSALNLPQAMSTSYLLGQYLQMCHLPEVLSPTRVKGLCLQDVPRS